MTTPAPGSIVLGTGGQGLTANRLDTRGGAVGGDSAREPLDSVRIVPR